jgi:isopenicillin-N epimerase
MADDQHQLTRRDFLRVAGATSVGALAGNPTLAAVMQATAAVAQQPAEQTAADEGYWQQIRSSFTLDPSLINLNNGNSSPCATSVHDALKRYLDTSNLLPVVHRGQLEQRFDEVRRGLAAEFGCDPAELAITRNATEALTIAQAGLDLRPGDEVLTTDQDYPRMLWMWDQRARREGVVIRRIQFPVPADAQDLLNRFEAAITPRTRVVHFCHITNTTGQLFPVRDLARLARARGAVSIVDGAHAAGHISLSLRDLECDIYGTSLHKWLMAPHGTGFLYVRRELIERLWPLQGALPEVSGIIQKFEEIGTQAAAPRVALGDALAFHQTIGVERKAARLHYLTRRWMDALANHPRVRLLSSNRPDQTWGVATLTVDGMPAPALTQQLLDRYRIVTSAVVSQRLPGPVFDFQGLRVSPGIYTTPVEIDRFVDAMRNLLA